MTISFVTSNFKNQQILTAQVETPIFDSVLIAQGYSEYNATNVIKKGNYTVDSHNLKGPVFDTSLNNTLNDTSVKFIPRLQSQDPINIKFESFSLVAIKGFAISGRDSSVQYSDFVALSEVQGSQTVLFGKYSGEIVGNLKISGTAIESSAPIHVGTMSENNVVFAVFGVKGAPNTLKVVTYDFSNNPSVVNTGDVIIDKLDWAISKISVSSNTGSIIVVTQDLSDPSKPASVFTLVSYPSLQVTQTQTQTELDRCSVTRYNLLNTSNFSGMITCLNTKSESTSD